MNKKLLHTFFALAFLLCSTTDIQAQTCSGDAPVSYTVVNNPANPAECFLQINWGDSMPELLCGSPGSPAPGSTIPPGQRVEFLYATINGTEYTLYDRFDCPSGNGLEYGAEANTFITSIGEVDFCLAEAERFINLEGVLFGGDDFDCLLFNSLVAAPVELVYFKAQPSDKGNKLEWATSSEENTAAFAIEKSTDGRQSLQTIGSQEAKGFSSTLEVYQFEDTNPRPLTYYRLRAIDFDGAETLSQWVAVRREGKNDKKILEVSPVPLGNEPLRVFYEANSDEAVILTISDINGRKLWEERKEVEAGIHNWQLEFPDFQQQLLIFRLHGKDGVSSQLIPCEKGF